MISGNDFSNLDFIKESLTEAEVSVAWQIVAGRPYKSIAEHNGVTVRTVETHINRIRRTLHIENGPDFRVILFLYLIHNKILDPADFRLSVIKGPE